MNKSIQFPFGPDEVTIHIPQSVDVLKMPVAERLSNPETEIKQSLQHAIGTPGLDEIVRQKLASKPDATAVIVISDHTRPVPYRGSQGILWPIIELLLQCGVPQERILVLVAPGTHRPLTDTELKTMLDERVFSAGIPIKSHNARDTAGLTHLGRTPAGSEVFVNSDYLNSDIKILTGLVETHFIAGFSGGRKSVCPGLIGEETTFLFHSAEYLSAPGSRDLNLVENPLHEEAVQVARIAGVDFIVNVTLNRSFDVTGVFSGDLEQAHLAATELLRRYVEIRSERKYDIVITHAGFVGINHYQSVKAGLAAMGALRKGGWLIAVAANTDVDPIGTQRYQSLLHLMKMIGPEQFVKLIFSPDWTFVPDQWEVQAWSNLLMHVPPDRFVYYSPQMNAAQYAIIPGIDGNRFLPAADRYQNSNKHIQAVIDGVLELATAELGDSARIAFLADGPYGIVARQ
ncbi:MAG: nickel-dependent lactate racemase [Spirochaetaceae bacterium]|nr:MAG: nickel-dependent lactate racemase [Spirochaetaceae bacterium]